MYYQCAYVCIFHAPSTQIMQLSSTFLPSLGLGEEMLVTTLPLNYYTTSLMLQQVMEKPLEKKAGKNYGPPGTKKLVYFIDDMNMPEVDTYGTVQPHTLIRQVGVW